MNRIMNQQVGRKIRNFRESRRLTQEEFAAPLGLDAKYLSNIERGMHNISVEKLFNICAVYQVDPKELLPEIHIQDGDTEEIRRQIAERLKGLSGRQLLAVLQFLDIVENI